MQKIEFRWWQSLSPAELRERLEAGWFFARYEYVASLVFLTVRWQSKMHLCRTQAGLYYRAIPYVIFTAVLGWWGLPWGPIESLKAIWNNLGGGLDATEEIENWLDQQEEAIASANPLIE